MLIHKSIEFRYPTYQKRLYYITKDNSNRIAYVVCFWDYDNFIKLRSGKNYIINGTLSIVYLHVDPEYRNQKIGTTILKYAMNDAKNSGIRVATLDDMSDNYRMNNNIYLQNGFNYLNDDGPEMLCKF